MHERTGIWLRDGKEVMLAARLSRRLRLHGLRNFADYYSLVQASASDSDELREFINCVTTNKTSFFRERHHFDYLRQTIVPGIQAKVGRGESTTVRIWSAACSTGEEAYTIAITLLEAISGAMKIEIVASDIDTDVLATASRGIYRADSLEEVDSALHKKYFMRGKDDMCGYVKVKPELTRVVQFAHINLMEPRWPIEGPFDVIFFRNALIYFKQETQDVFLRKMARLLKPGGHLFLGNSEHIPWLNDVFAPLCHTMYRLRDVK